MLEGIQNVFDMWDEAGSYTSFLNFRYNRQQGYWAVIFGKICIAFLKDWRDICLFQFVNCTPSLKLKVITAVMDGAKAKIKEVKLKKYHQQVVLKTKLRLESD